MRHKEERSFKLLDNLFATGNEFLYYEGHGVFGFDDYAEVTVLARIKRLANNVTVYSIENELGQNAVAETVADN